MTNRRESEPSPETASSTPFYIAGTMFAVAAALGVASIVTDSLGAELVVGEVFIAAGWIAGLVGLLGFYPALADRSRWLSRAGAAFSIVGIVAFVVLAAASLFAFFTGAAVERGVSVAGLPLVYLVPGIILAPILAFASYSAAALRTGRYPRTVGILLVVPSLIVFVNVATPPTVAGREFITLGIKLGLTLVMLTLGYVLGTAGSSTDHAESAADTTAD